MPKKNCTVVHPGRPSGPCISCDSYHSGDRYTHLAHKKENSPLFYEYVKQSYQYGDDDCICRKCDVRFQREMTEKSTLEQNDDVSPAKKVDLPPCHSSGDTSDMIDENITALCFLSSAGACSLASTISISVNKPTLVSCFSNMFEQADIQDHQVIVDICQTHFDQFQTFLGQSNNCCICEKKIDTGAKHVRSRSVRIVPSKVDIFQLYLNTELQLEGQVIEGCSVCVPCYNDFNRFIRSEEGCHLNTKTDSYLKDCLAQFVDTECTADNLDMYCFYVVLHHVVQQFLSYNPLLLSDLYSLYRSTMDENVQFLGLELEENILTKFQHSRIWLFRMLKSRLGPALLDYVPPTKKKGRMIYRNGTDLLHCLHTVISNKHNEVNVLKQCNITLKEKVSTVVAEEDSSFKQLQCLNKAVTILKKHLKLYVKDAIKSQLPDIHCFDLHDEIKKLNPSLWNFIYKLTSSEEEEMHMNKHMFCWDSHYMGVNAMSSSFENCRLFPRLYIASCLFNSYSSHCVQPLHLLNADILDKYSTSSTELLTLSSRLGACTSKDTLKRYITRRGISLYRDSIITTNSFAIASFDNLDKNQSYAFVGHGKDRSGFHGTTIQAVVSKPSVKLEVSEILDHVDVEIGSTCTGSECSDKTVIFKSARNIPPEIIRSLNVSEHCIGDVSGVKINRFSDLTVESFNESASEVLAWEQLEGSLTSYSLLKTHVHGRGICIPGLKTYLSYGDKQTEKSDFHAVAVLNDPADSKETVLKTLNILHHKFQIGKQLRHLVVVGDGKSYDHLIKIKSEYGSVFDWVLAYPGDWHILKNILPVLVKIYFDAGLKELALKYHHGATLKVLIECTKFSMTHRFFVHVWEAIYRYQVEQFISCSGISDMSRLDEILSLALEESLASNDQAVDFSLWSKVFEQKQALDSFTGSIQGPFQLWRQQNCAASETFRFWDTFVHTDFLAYLGLYIGIRSRNWDLRNVSLKKLACLFHAFDRHNYLRMIPYHLADLMTFPQPVLEHFKSGCFSVSISGENFYSVALDEAHEMEINLKTKQAIHSFSPSALTELTYYLPYRAETLFNIKSQLCMEKTEHHHRETSKPYIKTEELTICHYIDQLKTSLLFRENVDPILQHIFTKITATKEQSDSLLNYRKYGITELQNYIKCILIQSDKLTGKAGRKRLNLKTFSMPKVTVPKQKKEIKDNQTIITCLRKQIAFSKMTQNPVTDLGQFTSLPRAISDASGLPTKGTKSHALNALKSIYPDAFITSLPNTPPNWYTTVILEGMFLINSIPVSTHRTFGDYAEFLFTRWVLRSYHQFNASEVHVVFDDPNRHGASPKDIERLRRDGDLHHTVTYTSIAVDTLLPGCWRIFLSVREQKRKLVNFLSYQFLHLALQKFAKQECFFVTAGGFDDENKDLALGSHATAGLVEVPLLQCNHEEGDTRVWFHALASQSHRIIIYSPDTDTFFIGLPLLKQFQDRSVFIQSKDSVIDHQFIDMKKFVSLLSNDIQLQGLANVEECMQMLYIASGCDFVSYFHGYGKKTFFNCFRHNALFISSDLSHCSIEENSGLMAFYKLILCVYFSRHRSAFHNRSSVEELFNSITSGDNTDQTVLTLVHTFREKMWERIVSEDEMLPNAEALKLHWQRCCWVFKYWSQASIHMMSLASVSLYGWILTDGKISVTWDTDLNEQKVKDTIHWYTKGCACKSGCATNRCSCRKGAKVGQKGYCGPCCKCTNCVNLPSTSTSFGSESDSEVDSETETEALPESDSDTDSDNDSIQDMTGSVDYWDTFKDLILSDAL